jgi:hypothetical protein
MRGSMTQSVQKDFLFQLASSFDDALSDAPPRAKWLILRRLLIGCTLSRSRRTVEEPSVSHAGNWQKF